MVNLTLPDRDNTAMAKLRLALERELAPDEVVQWHGWQLGQIDPRAFMSYIFALPSTVFSLAWTGVAATAVAMSNQTGLGLFAWAFPLFGTPFVAVGAWMLSRPFVPLWEHGRVLKLSIGRTLSIKTVPADRIGLIQRSERADSAGTLSLAIRIGADSEGNRQTESFDIGLVADVMGAQTAIDRIAASARLVDGSAGALSP